MTNLLAKETSPYLLQHANNPVDWHPWGKLALAKARKENKPILLSIGYSACHWCHVMARESFSDQGTAKIMNEYFINIKVDREERPDLDKIYQSAHYLLTQRSGGWPLTIFLLPDDLIPFFAGTYFPKRSLYATPSFIEVLTYLHKILTQQKPAIIKQNKQVSEALKNLYNSKITIEHLDDSPLQKVIPELYQSYDWEYGGFGRAPKFPNPTYLERLLYQALLNGDNKSLEMICFTLNKMADSGLYDQLAGGFYRYCVNRQWTIPHFEKMLYDNAQLLTLYSLSFAATHKRRFQNIGNEVANWLLTCMRSGEGGFYSTMSADTEGQEGKYYIWQSEQVREILSGEEYLLLSRYFGLDKAPNFEKDWHLQIKEPLKSLAQSFNLSEEQASHMIKKAKNKLLAVRNKRIQPEIDNKILTSWNGLVIKALCTAGMYLKKDNLIIHAQKTVDFIQNYLWKNNRLLASYKDKRAQLTAYLDDYAFLLDALICLLQAKWRTSDLNFAIDLAESLLTHFEDKDDGGFFFTANDHERLMVRPKIFTDEAMPAGNAYASSALLKLGYLLGEPRYIQAAEKTVKTAWDQIKQRPTSHTTLLSALEDLLTPPTLIIIRGKLSEINTWQQAVRKQFHPQQLCFAIAESETKLPEMLHAYKSTKGTTAYVCKDIKCHSPINQLKILLKTIQHDLRIDTIR